MAQTETKQAPETIEEIARRLPQELYNIVCFSCSEAFCTHWQENASDMILSALRNERDRCAKVAESFNEKIYNGSAGVFDIAEAIRQGSQ